MAFPNWGISFTITIIEHDRCLNNKFLAVHGGGWPYPPVRLFAKCLSRLPDGHEWWRLLPPFAPLRPWKKHHPGGVLPHLANVRFYVMAWLKMDEPAQELQHMYISARIRMWVLSHCGCCGSWTRGPNESKRCCQIDVSGRGSRKC